MDEDTSRAAARLDRLAERINAGMAILVRLFIALAVLYVLAAWLMSEPD